VRLGLAARGIALALIVVAPAVAVADPSPEDIDEAKVLVQRAVTSSQAGDHEISAQLYQRAYKLSHEAVLLSNIAAEYELIKKSQWALTYYCEYLRADPNGPNVAFAREHIHAYAVAMNEAAPESVEVVCETTGKPEVPIIEEPVKPPPPPVKPPPVVPVKQPVHQPPPPPEGRRMSPLRIGAIALTGLGAVGFGVGVYYGTKAKSIENDLNNHPVDDPWPPDLRDREAQGKSYNRRAIGFMAAGGAAVAIGVAGFFLLHDHDASSSTAMVTPVITGDSVGVVAAGSF
jgi:hypothetical protein